MPTATLSETTVSLRDLRNDWLTARSHGGRLFRIPDIGTQVFPLDCPDRFDCPYIPPYFWKYSLWLNPLQGFWEYQVTVFNHFFGCWYDLVDGTDRQARQTGKSTTIPIPLSYLIIEEHIQTVIISTKVEKTRKLTRPIRKAMWKDGRFLAVDSLEETRFDENEAGYKALSGSADAKKESETAHVIVVDEAQDIPYSPTYKEISPMRKGVGGIIFAMGIGGFDESMMMTMTEQVDVRNLNIRYDEIPERPKYRADVELERTKMLSVEFDSNYKGERTSRVSNALIENLPEWSELFPSIPFSPSLLTEAEIGMDFAAVQDDTCAVARGIYGDVHVIYDYDFYRKGEPIATQIEGLVKFMMRVDFDALRPENNHLGRVVIQMLASRMEEELRKAGWNGDIEKIWKPITVTDRNIDHACRTIHELSASNRLCYVDNGKNPHVKRCIADLRNVGVKTGAQRMLKMTHSDWMAAFRVMYCGKRLARVSA